MTEVLEFLQAEWDTLVASSADNKSTDNKSTDNKIVAHDYFKKLIAAYSEPHRAYHTPSHIQHMIQLLHNAAVSDPCAFWASFYHDYVYWPGTSDNEILSAEIAANQLLHMDVQQNLVMRVRELIIATKQHKISHHDISGSAFLDADMAILGASAEEYEKYSIAVRKEFSKTPQFLFNLGRKNFLRKVSGQPRIYITEWFFDRFEKTARSNIKRELNG